MKLKKIAGAVLAFVMMVGSVNVRFAAEIHAAEDNNKDTENLLTEYIGENENIVPFAASYTDTYEAEGGCIYFNADTGSITDCDTSVTSADIPNTINGVSVTSIGGYAFSGCSSLTSVTIPSGVTSIGEHAFYYCTCLSGIAMPNSIKSIGKDAFFRCTSLSTVEIPDSVTDIGEMAFYNCTALKDITIPDNVANIGSYAFSWCTSLLSISVNEGNSYYCSVDGVLYSKDKTKLIAYPNKKASSYTIPNEVTAIGVAAFNGCSNIKSVDIPDSVTEIGKGVFAGCGSLKSIDIPESVTVIGSENFWGCTSLTSVSLPSNITSIGSSMFYNCNSLKRIDIPDGVTSIGSDAFYMCASLSNIDIPSSVTSIGSSAFLECTYLSSINIPSGVSQISSYAFSGCKNLKSIELPNTVTSIGYAAFRSCTSLVSITVPSSVTNIGSDVFKNCSQSKLVFYVYEGSYIDTWATENGWTVSYISNDSTTEDTFRNLDINLSVDKDIVYNVDEDTYNTDSISLGGYIGFIYIFRGSEDYEIGYPKNVSVTITLPEGFYFGNDDGTESEENTKTKVVTFDEITGIEYMSETIYFENPTIGTAVATVTVTGDNVIEKTVTCDIVVAKKQFNLSKYRADYVLGSSFGSDIEDLFMGTYETPASALKTSAEESGLDIATNAWSTFMNSLAVADDLSNISDYALEESEMYEAIIFELLESSVDYRVTECINNDLTKFAKKMTSTVTSEMKSLYNMDYSTLNDLTKLTTSEKETITDIMSKSFKEEHPDAASISKITSFIGTAINTAEDFESFCETVASYYEITQLNDAMKQILQDMSDNCPADNEALKTALINCTNIMDDSMDELTDDMAARALTTLGLKVGTAVLDKFWSTAKESLLTSSPAAFAYYALKASYVGSKYITELLFNADSIEEKYCNIVALVETEEVLRTVYTDEKNSYKNNLTEEAADIYNNVLDVMFNMLNTDCDYAIAFADAVDKGAINGLMFWNSTLEDFTDQVSGIKDDYSQIHEQVLKNWIYELEEEYPSQYENYKYILELTGDDLSKVYEIECPVDVYVYDSDNVCVGYVIDNKPFCRSDAQITIGVLGNQKTIYLYGENEYTIVYKGNDTGNMDIAITEYNTDGNATRNVYFNDIALSNDLTYTSDESIDMSEYTLTSETGASIKANYDSSNESSEIYTVTITNGYFSNSPSFSAEFHAGEKVEIAALLFGDNQFVKWNSDANTDIFDDYSSIITEFTMPEYDVNITANINTYGDSIIYGDADGNGTLDASDAAYVLQYVLNNSFCESDSQWTATVDVDGNGEISAADAASILQKVLNASYKFPVE